MVTYLIVGGTIVLAILLVVVFRRESSPSTLMIVEISKALSSLQKSAASQISKSNDCPDLQQISQAETDWAVQQVQKTIRLIYTIDEEDNRFVHTVSSQLLKRKSKNYQATCMLFIFAILNKQLETAGIDTQTVPFELSESALGTHFISMLLSRDENSKFLAANK